MVDKIEWPYSRGFLYVLWKLKVVNFRWQLYHLSASDILWNFSLFHLWRVKDDCCIFQLFPCPICQGWVMMIVAALFRLQVCNYYLFYFCNVSNWNVHQTTVCKLVYFGLKILYIISLFKPFSLYLSIYTKLIFKDGRCWVYIWYLTTWLE